jgi:hypothetical protein
MENTVLTERQSACRAAHEQVQLLQHLYGRLAEEHGSHQEIIDERRRTDELREDRQMLVAKLKSLGLLRTEPDPEREGLLDIATELKRAFGGRNVEAVTGRLATEEREFLHRCQQLADHDDDDAIGVAIERTQAAIERLESV